MDAEIRSSRVLQRTCVGLICILWQHPSLQLLARASDPWSFSQLYAISDADYRSVLKDPILQSFDLSSDGHQVAVLALEPRVGGELWIATENLSPTERVGARNLGPIDPKVSGGEFAPQVFYTHGGRIVVNDFRSVRLIDPKTLEIVANIESPKGSGLFPLSISVARDADVIACAFGARQQFDYKTHTIPVTIEIVSASTGAVLHTFAAPDVPQTISSDGRLIATSTTDSVNGVFPIAVFDSDGTKIAESAAGFGFKTEPIDRLGRIRAVFLAPRTLALSPNNAADRTGHAAGDAVQIAEITNGVFKLTARASLYHFAPSGEMAVSADQNVLVAMSEYVDPATIAAPHTVLNSLPPQALFFDNSGSTLQLRGSIPIQRPTLKSAVEFEIWRPRLSADGSVFAVGQASKITIFKRNR